MREERIGDATLYCADCREVLPTLSGVDAVVTDPPFSVPIKYHDTSGNYPRSWGDMMVMEPFFREVFQAVRRATGYRQVYICCDHNSYPVFYRVAYPLWSQSHLIVWFKPSGRRGRGWLHAHELVLHLRTPETEYADGFRQDVIGVMPVRTLDRQHPAEKPGGLIQFLLSAVPRDTGAVCDPFMGGGAFGQECVELGRHFIGIESDQYWFDVACRRIEQAHRQRDLFVHAPVQQPPEDARMADLFAAAAD